MEIINFFLHIDKHLNSVIQTYGVWSYGLLFFVIFMETGFVVTPFLPGDSLLFAGGSFAALGSFNIVLLYLLLLAAAVLGDTVNYWIGHKFGPKLIESNNRFIKKEHLSKTHRYFEKYGGKTIIVARFIPIVRTFAPFVAGIGSMTYKRFLLFNIIGGALWVSLFVFGGYFFGNIPIVKNNFTFVILVIIIISVFPAFYEYYQHKKSKQQSESKPSEE
jgi:membrane-associated protein